MTQESNTHDKIGADETSLHLPCALIILDGFACADPLPQNAIAHAQTPYLDKLFATFAHTTLGASGPDVGLPEGQMGNSEVGHLNIGAGRVVYQELTRIDRAIEDGSLFAHERYLEELDKLQRSGGTLHVMGLVSDGGVHSTLNHAKALIKAAANHGISSIKVHAFTDGRDVAPLSAPRYLRELETFCEELSAQTGSHIGVATVCGRYYAMDRDNRWERVAQAYDAIVAGKGAHARCGSEAAQASCDAGTTDEFIAPTVIDPAGVNDNDAVIFFNFRPDRARELTRAFVEPEETFTGFERSKVVNTAFMTLTEYDPTLSVKVLFPKTILTEVLADVIEDAGLRQYHTAETEKYAHVTFFLNGGSEAIHDHETRVLIDSPKVATYDLKPEMSAFEVTKRLVEAVDSQESDIYIVNYANCDMVGHTGNFEAAKKAVEAVDTCLSQLIPALLQQGGCALITADHGNADYMYSLSDTGEMKPFTAHTINRVPLILVDDKPAALKSGEHGRLCDIAPTLLDMIGLPVPESWDGVSLLDQH